jgi:iron complex outermembrane receptor protein
MHHRRDTIWRHALLAGAAGLSWATGARAGDAPTPGASVQELVVVGSRGAPRLATETAAPVDVLGGDLLAQRGYDDLSKMLQVLAPSFNFPRSSTAPSSANTRSATLRGLSPDQVLVLVDGHRRHASSVLNFNNTIGRGTTPVDFNTLPASAIAQVEILRDGAAAQYGSDAIAGVINIVLRHDADGGAASVQYGQTEKADGATTLLTLRQGFSLGGEGFLTVDAEARNREHTNSAQIDPRVGRITQRHGDPDAYDLNLALNAERSLGAVTAYAFATLDRRRSESAALFRLPTVDPAIYPNGFLPLIKLRMTDLGGAAGLRGDWAGWAWDLSSTFGYDRADFHVADTANTSLGLASPHGFDGGGGRYVQNLVDLSGSRHFGLLAGANLAGGLEYRYETFRIRPGEPLSFQGAGAQGFPGYNPPRPVDIDRHAQSAWLDGELNPAAGLTLGLAGRLEDYSDFGQKTTGKASAFWRTSPWLALRVSGSTGFRAPALQQQGFATVTSQLSAGQLVNVGTFSVNDPVATALGGTPLRPETSKSWSAGLVLTPLAHLSLTADAFRIDIADRIALSESLTGPAVAAILAAHHITNASQVRFFTNAADTRTEGWEAAVHWSGQVGANGDYNLTLVYGSYDNDLTRLRANPVLPALPLLAAAAIATLTDAQPRNKLTLGGDMTLGAWRLSGDIVRYGDWTAAPLGPLQTFGDKTTVDLSAAYALTKALRVQAGVVNATNQYPDRVIGSSDGRPYTEGGGLGVDGREYFVRLSARW